MSQSFYHYMLTQRNPNDHSELAEFAKNVGLDHGFPKQAEDFDSLSAYLELNGNYLPSMSVFDEAYRAYQAMEGA